MNTAKTLMETLTPQEQAEAMAKVLRIKIEGAKGSPYSPGLAFDVEDILSTAISKLLEDNERLKKELRDAKGELEAFILHHEATDQIICDAQGLSPKDGKSLLYNMEKVKDQLTATEAKLDGAKEFIDTLICAPCKHEQRHGYCSEECDGGKCPAARAFLSTLTAEKKEEAK